MMCGNQPKCGKILAFVIILLAVLIAALASFLPPEKIGYVIVVSRFFDIMIPVLAVGALLKYICCPSKSSDCNTNDKGQCH